MEQYLVEFMGSLLISYAIVFTHESPTLVGLTHTCVIYLSRLYKIDAHFTPLSVFTEFLLNRMDILESITVIGIHLVAALSIVLIYQQKTLM